MGVELRGVHALDVGHAGLVLTTVLDAEGVLKDVGAFGEVVYVEVGGGVLGGFEVAETILIFVAGEDVDWLGTAGTVVFHVDVFHVAVDTEFDADYEFVTDCSFAIGREEFGAFLGGFLEVDGFIQLQLFTFMDRDFANVFHVLPVNRTPGDPFVGFVEGDFSKVGLHFCSWETVFIEPGASFDFFRFDGMSPDGNFH